MATNTSNQNITNNVNTDDDFNYLQKIYNKKIDITSEMLNDKELMKKLSKNTDFLYDLSNHKDQKVREMVASSLDTPYFILDKLSNDNESSVRILIAKNPNTRTDTLIQLSKDFHYNVKKSVASNYNTPSHILQYLAENENILTQISVRGNPSTSPSTLQHLSENENPEIRVFVASNPSTSLDTLRSLVNDGNDDVRFSLSSNPNISSDILNSLSYSQPKITDKILTTKKYSLVDDETLKHIKLNIVRNNPHSNTSKEISNTYQSEMNLGLRF